MTDQSFRPAAAVQTAGDISDRTHRDFYSVEVVKPAPTRYETIVALVRRFGPRSAARVLEVGPERAAVAEAVTRGIGITKSQYACVESSESSRVVLDSSGFNAILCDVSKEDLPFPDSTFDVVIASEVLEHLYSPDRLLRSTRRVLAPGGLFVCTTPNLASWFNRALLGLGVQPIFTETGDEWVYGRSPFLSHSRPVGHLHVFTLPALREMLTSNGFEILTELGLPTDEIRSRSRLLAVIDRVLSRGTSWSADLVVAARVAK